MSTAPKSTTTFDKQAGRNISYTIQGDTLLLSIPVTPAVIAAAPLSKSQKTNVIATTNGNVGIMLPGGREMKLGINAYVAKQG